MQPEEPLVEDDDDDDDEDDDDDDKDEDDAEGKYATKICFWHWNVKLVFSLKFFAYVWSFMHISVICLVQVNLDQLVEWTDAPPTNSQSVNWNLFMASKPL